MSTLCIQYSGCFFCCTKKGCTAVFSILLRVERKIGKMTYWGVCKTKGKKKSFRKTEEKVCRASSEKACQAPAERGIIKCKCNLKWCIMTKARQADFHGTPHPCSVYIKRKEKVMDSIPVAKRNTKNTAIDDHIRKCRNGKTEIITVKTEHCPDFAQKR